MTTDTPYLPLTSDAIESLLLLPSSDSKAILSTLPQDQQRAILQQLSKTVTPEMAKADPVAFRRLITIDCDGEERSFASVIDPWQLEDFEAMDPAWRRVAGHQADVKHQYSWQGRPRGHSKTTDIAVMVSFALFASEKKIDGVVGAGSKHQAGFVRDGIDKLCRLNPWLAEVIEVQNYRVMNRLTGSTLQILAADEGTNYGALVDFIICDELTHWKNRGLWDALFSAAAKKKNCLVVVITNAGNSMGTGWQWSQREMARKSFDGGGTWYFNELDGPHASWIDDAALVHQRLSLTPSQYARLWLNQWTRGGGDAFDLALVDAAITLEGPTPHKRDDWHPFIGGLDLGINHDHTGFVVLGIDVDAGRLKLAKAQAWRPEDFGGTIDLEFVEREILKAQNLYGLMGVYYDPTEATYLSQRLEKQGVNMVPVRFTTTCCNMMAERMLRSFRGQIIDLYPDDVLIRDLGKLNIVEKKYGVKLEGPRDDEGHCDVATAFMIVNGIGIEFLDEMHAAPLSGAERVGAMV